MLTEKQSFVYILSNWRGNVLYTGYEHKTSKTTGFSRKYNVDRLVYFEQYTNITLAIAWEKQIKVLLISKFNPAWLDRYNNV